MIGWEALDGRAAHPCGVGVKGAGLPAFLRGPGGAGVAGFLLVAQSEEVAVGGEGVAGWGLRGGGVVELGLVVVEGLALGGGHAFHVVVLVAEAFPAFIVLLSLFVAFVAYDCFVC